MRTSFVRGYGSGECTSVDEGVKCLCTQGKWSERRDAQSVLTPGSRKVILKVDHEVFQEHG